MAVVGRGSDQFMLRFPDGMRDAVRKAAEAAHRSMNSEIVYQLQRIYGSAVAATGERFADATPAAARNTTALQGGNATHNG